MKKTLLLGASDNPDRYAYKATKRLLDHGHEVVLVGHRDRKVLGQDIQLGTPEVMDIDTVTLYLHPLRQEAYHNYIINLSPKRIIYNPGTENPILMKMAKDHGIINEVACTLVMLSVGTY